MLTGSRKPNFDVGRALLCPLEFMFWKELLSEFLRLPRRAEIYADR